MIMSLFLKFAIFILLLFYLHPSDSISIRLSNLEKYIISIILSLTATVRAGNAGFIADETYWNFPDDKI